MYEKNKVDEAINKFIETFTNLKEYQEMVDDEVNSRLDKYDKIKRKFWECCYEEPYNPNFTEHQKMMFNRFCNYTYDCMNVDGYTKRYCNTSFVYFLRNNTNGLLKIGTTNDLQRRFKDIQRGFKHLGFGEQDLRIEALSYCVPMVDNKQVEVYYHNLFKDYRKSGEWFDITLDTLLNQLNVDYNIGDVIVVIEDKTDFVSPDFSIRLTESNVNKLKTKVQRDLITKAFELMNMENLYFLSTLFSRMKINKERNPKYIYVDSDEMYGYLYRYYHSSYTFSVDEKICILVEKEINKAKSVVNNKNTE